MSRGRPAARRRQMIAYVRATIDVDGVAPSYGMICRALGIATRGEVSRMVSDAERLGHLRRVGAGKVRRLRICAY